MAQRAVSREHFRGLFALYACAAQHGENCEGAIRLLRLFASSESISDDLLDRWVERADAVGSGAVGYELGLRAHAVADGHSNYDHASAFLHALLKALDQRAH